MEYLVAIILACFLVHIGIDWFIRRRELQLEIKILQLEAERNRTLREIEWCE